jgi:uncharacterized protein
MELIQFVIFAFIGLVSGFLSGLFGIGGGSVRIPLLVMAGVPIINAYATNMIAIPFSSATGAFTQRINIDWNIVKYVIIGGAFGVALATFFVGMLSPLLLVWIFLFASILTTIGLYLDVISAKLSERIQSNKWNVIIGIFILNFIIGLRGGSGGTLFPPFLKMMHLEMHRAIATSLMASFVTGTIASLIYLFRGEIIWIIAMSVIFFDMLGSYMGSNVSMNSHAKFLKAGLAILVFVLAVYVVIRQYTL